MVRLMYYRENQHQINFECVLPDDKSSVNNPPFNCPSPLEVQKQSQVLYTYYGDQAKG